MTESLKSNIRIRELPAETDRLLNELATRRQVYKHELVRDALIEFAERHKDEIAKAG